MCADGQFEFITLYLQYCWKRIYKAAVCIDFEGTECLHCPILCVPCPFYTETRFQTRCCRLTAKWESRAGLKAPHMYEFLVDEGGSDTCFSAEYV